MMWSRPAGPDTVAAQMYSFLARPKWIGFHLLVIGAIVLMVNLGFWQLRRLDQRRDFNATIEARYDNEPLEFDDVDLSDPAAVEWQPVIVDGRYLPDGSVQIVNRSQGGRAGENTVTPLQLDDGRVLLVNRGFTPLDAAAPAAPAGAVTIEGRLRRSEERHTGQLSDPAGEVLEVAQRVDVDRLQQQFDAELVPMYVDMIASSPADGTPYPEPVIRPDLSEGNHLSYAVQWYLFSAAVAVGWVLAVRHSARARRAPVPSAGSEPAPS